MAVVSVVRTGMAWSSLECWLFILSAVAWARGGRRECESFAGGCKAAVGQGREYDRFGRGFTLVIEVLLKSIAVSR